MIDANLITELKRLSPNERLELIGFVWDSLEPSQIPVTEAEKQLLDERLYQASEHLSAESAWPEVKQRLRQRLR